MIREEWVLTADKMTVDQARQAVKDLRKQLVEQNNWIPVGVRLPETNGRYLVTRQSHYNQSYIDVILYIANLSLFHECTNEWLEYPGWYEYDTDGYYEVNVKAWQRLPELYK